MSGKRWLWFLIRSQRRTLHLLRYAPKSNELRRFELGIQAYRDQIRLIARPDGVRLFILRQRPGKRPLETQIVAEQIDLDRYGTRRRRRREIAIPLPYRREFSPLFRVEESGRRWFLGFWGHRRAFRVDFPR